MLLSCEDGQARGWLVLLTNFLISLLNFEMGQNKRSSMGEWGEGGREGEGGLIEQCKPCIHTHHWG